MTDDQIALARRLVEKHRNVEAVVNDLSESLAALKPGEWGYDTCQNALEAIAWLEMQLSSERAHRYADAEEIAQLRAALKRAGQHE